MVRRSSFVHGCAALGVACAVAAAALAAFTVGPLVSTPSLAMQVPDAAILYPGAEFLPRGAESADPSLRRALESQFEKIDGPAQAALRQFYAARDYALFFIADNQWTPRAKQLIAELGDAQRRGLDSRDYTQSIFYALAPHADSAQQAEAESLLAQAVLAFARHLQIGRVDRPRVRAMVKRMPQALAPSKILEDLETGSDMAALLDGYEPPHPEYKHLKQALQRALEHEANPLSTKPSIAHGPVINLGKTDERVPQLRARFALAQSPGVNEASKPVMDAALVAAVRNFQEENGLYPTGSIDRRTVNRLNAGQAIARTPTIPDLLINMERWRWQPRDLGARHVFVNIPEYLVRVRQGAQTTYEGRVVVGKPQTPTPLFSDTIEYIVVNPSWYVPQSIVQKELIPLIITNPEAFARRGIEVTRTHDGWTFRQPPSERNALGRIKFMFPNEHAVYLHDTPSKAYFQRESRAFSHGCVRVDTPLKFADALLAGEAHVTATGIARLYGRNETTLRLQQKIPVHLVYFTALAGADGEVSLRGDVYGLDSSLKAALGLKKRG